MSVLVRLVEPGHHLGEHQVRQDPLRRSPFRPGPVRSRSDLATVRAQRPADRCDPEPRPVLGDETADPRRGGSHSRTKKVVAAWRISIVLSSSAFFRFSSRICAADSDGTPGAAPASTACRIHFRSVSAFIPNRPDTAVIAAHSEAYHRHDHEPDEPPGPSSRPTCLA